MSYGTILYPELQDFPLLKDVETTKETVDNEIDLMANYFGVFRTLAMCTPRNVCDKPLEELGAQMQRVFESYLEAYDMMSDLRDALDLHDQNSRIEDGETYEDGTPKRPYLYYNHFVYHSREEAESLIVENTTELAKVKSRIFGICLATPIDITPKSSTNDNYEPLYYIEHEMDYLEEALDDCLRSIRVAKLVAKYWDGHEEG